MTEDVRDAGGRSVAAELRRAVRALDAAGVESAAHDARVLMAAALSVDGGAPVGPLDVVLRGSETVPDGFSDLLARRISREPLQWILGRGSVVGLDLVVEPGVFIPRPETDLLIDWAAGEAQRRVSRRESTDLHRRLVEPTLTVVDLCSGPGTIALGLAHLLTERGVPDRVDVRIVGVEITGQGVALAQDNERLWKHRGDVDRRIRCDFHRGDASSTERVISLGLVGAADIVVSNPPYVPETSVVSREVEQDPHRAVFSGQDGLALMRPLARTIDLVAAPSAGVGVEHDDSTGAAVQELLAGVGVTDLEQHRDLAGRDRFVTGNVHRDPGHRPVRG